MTPILKRLISTVVAAGGSIYAAVVGYLYFNQTEMLYRANPVRITAVEAGLANVRELTLQPLDGEQIHAWYSPAINSKSTILFCHGKGGNMANRAKRWRYYVERGFGVMFFDYHGFGGSTGVPTEEHLRMDARAAYDWLRAEGIASTDIALVGESLGTGVCAMLAADADVASLEMQAGYSSIVGIAAEHYWWAPVKWLIKDSFDATQIIGKIRAPLFQQHGDRDNTIPPHFGKALFAVAPSPKEFFLVPNGSHALGPEGWQRGLDFIDAVRAGKWKPKS
jgi:uncharacterized protein